MFTSCLLPPFKDPDTSISSDMIQILLFLDLPFAAAVSATRNSDHTTYILRDASIKQPETQNRLRLMRQ